MHGLADPKLSIVLGILVTMSGGLLEISVTGQLTKVKGVFVHAIETYGGVKAYLHSFLTSSLNLGEWLASRPGQFTPEGGGTAPYTLNRWLGEWVPESVCMLWRRDTALACAEI